jgi:hypothetical protein
MSPATKDDPKFLAAVDLIRRTGAAAFKLRHYSEKDKPKIVWVACVTYPDGKAEVDASQNALSAVLRLAERLLDGGQCQHCGRPSGLDPDSLDRMPVDEFVCWYQFDPGSAKFIRGCAK